MAADAQWAAVAAMLPFSADLLDATGKIAEFRNLTTIDDTVGNPFGAGNAAYHAGYSSGPNASGGIIYGYVGLSSNFSIQLACYPVSGGHGSTDSILLQVGTSDTAGSLRIVANDVDDPMRLRVTRYNGSAYVDLIAVPVATITSDAWHWIQLDRVTNTFTLYVDGAEYSTATQSVSLGGDDIMVCQNGQTQNLWKGYMAQLRVTTALRASHAVPADPWPRPTISGTILDVLGNPVSRVVRCIPRAVAVQAISDPVTGVYTAYPTSYADHIVIRIDTTDDPPIDGTVVGSGNAMVLDRVTPGS
jgi:hypothetical protein